MKGKQVLPGQVADQQCGGKICYTTESAALKAMKSAREKRGDMKIHKERRVYQCPSCRFWHVTSLSISMKHELRSQSKDREAAFRGIETTLSGSLPVDEAFEVLKRMNADRLAGKEMRPVGIYIKKEEKRRERNERKGRSLMRSLPLVALRRLTRANLDALLSGMLRGSSRRTEKSKA